VVYVVDDVWDEEGKCTGCCWVIDVCCSAHHHPPMNSQGIHSCPVETYRVPHTYMHRCAHSQTQMSLVDYTVYLQHMSVLALSTKFGFTNLID
jgi:hypothetical protein